MFKQILSTEKYVIVYFKKVSNNNVLYVYNNISIVYTFRLH